ncbi:ATP-binding protein [Tenacibaculum finnmarkense genomovar finnmarkense]|uniref:ATP-dependent nuclease n=1 Tax=Tenacibaculum finnmarkense TaxID=2781243 RepID=UPI001E4C3A5C|nr:AAA family ATPase [Tenacibaculum finnmarkense]MCD8417229.1 ATP-binding protein [Tenacibaculum finnmarkense genomovar finnmarkense]MCG8185612.1 ATP-binding protein [Tenacibaculum finnmarkense genomovar finnmarkense]MCG8202160.1 ATP-binding protein [Tenacibaculum finnmarkense genomovar finnmarkense]MCG8209552.1 ATP-binding protein [Tenacibaculum finnmarkense genomovar finnmarkense]MCG8212350.1 ATP-binding protein [Tenacibaculum finnmarkense genomovar finnmarkense]
MKLVIKDIDGLNFPQEFKSPEYYIDKLGDSFATQIVKNNKSYYSAEIKINQINFFVGANNSGKSRFMRGLLKISPEPYEYICKQSLFIDLLEELKEIVLERYEDEILDKYNLSFKWIINDIPKEKGSLVDYDEEISHRLKFNIEELEKEDDLFENLKQYVKKLKDLVEETDFSKNNKISKKTYIPVLRSLLENPSLVEGTFKDTIKKVFFNDINRLPNHLKVDTGLNLWSDMSKIHNSRKIGDIENFSNFLSQHFFDNEKVQLLPDREGLKLIQININNKGFRGINEIGDGVQTIILLLFPIFTAYNNECFYIEEPETNLHPAFQRIFIETLLTNEILVNKNLKYFFTTHSNHFLDLTLRSDKVSFFQFQKIAENKHLIKTDIKPNKETLDELGVNNSSVFLANTSLWVEGPTDRKYLAKFLKLYCEEKEKPYLKEDIDFAFFEYGGNLIAHYLFDENQEFEDDEIREKINAFANANKIYLLADNDNVAEGSAKYSRQKKLEDLASENLYFKYQNTIVKEIENLLSVKVVKDFIPELLKTTSSKEKVKNIKFKKEDYDTEGIGQFIERILIDENIPVTDMKKFNAESGTLTNEYKNKLANFVIDRDYTYQDLIEDNEQLKTLIEDLYKFIKIKKV